MYEILEALMKEYNVKPYTISKATGLPSSLFTDWKKGRYTPKADKLTRIADYFGISVEAFYSDLSELPNFLKKTPVFDVAAGNGHINGDYAEEYISNVAEDSDEYSWCRIHGDSMYPELIDGDYIKVHLQTETKPDDLTVIKVNGESCTVKYVEIVSDGVWLRAINKAVYEDKFFTVQEVMTLPVTIIGKVVMSQRNF